MANVNKGFRGCKPNPNIAQRTPRTFEEYIVGFQTHSLKRGQADCACGGISLCTGTTLDTDRVRGHFVCRSCGIERELSVMFAGLQGDFAKLVGEQND